ncbi:MAG TPA: hypothetical protein VGH28_15550 [Polyangiaceae bacterium]|jgi:hypothetical protein
MNDRIAGYHFDLQLGPMMKAVLPLLRERARAVGIVVPDEDAYEKLRPRALMLRLTGTCWSGFRSGEVAFHVLEFRDELDAYVLRDPLFVTSKKLLASFGVHEEMKGWISYRQEKAAGLWIRDGSLIFHAWQDERRPASEQVIAEFDMWRALDAMARLASGEQTFGSPLGPVGPRTKYPTQMWARDFETTVTAEPANVSASFTSPTLMVAGVVTLIERHST